MAVIASNELALLRQAASRKCENLGIAVVWTKAQANSAFQAVEDYEVGAHTTRPSGSRRQAINAAVPGLTLDLTQEQILWGCWARWKIKDLGV